MHIEPGVVDGAKMILGYVTAAGAATYTLKRSIETVIEAGAARFGARAATATALAFSFFQVLPHFPVGVSEVHFILGSTLFLIFGAAPAAIGLGLALLIQGLVFAPFDLPQYGMNLTTLLVPLFALQALAHRVVPAGTVYADLTYGQALKLSTAYQGGVVAWVAFWAFYGQGFGAASAVVTFGAAYMTVILIEPLIDLAALATAKALKGRTAGLVDARVYSR